MIGSFQLGLIYNVYEYVFNTYEIEIYKFKLKKASEHLPYWKEVLALRYFVMPLL